MQDVTIPTLSGQNLTPSLLIPQTQAQLNNQGNTFNQAGHSFNQAGDTFGGIYNQDQDTTPLITFARLDQPSFTVLSDRLSLIFSNTKAKLSDQGLTFNQAGHSFNQTGDVFGGLYNQDQDTLPITLTFEDLYTLKPTPPPPGGKQSVGPGWFLYVTH